MYRNRNLIFVRLLFQLYRSYSTSYAFAFAYLWFSIFLAHWYYNISREIHLVFLSREAHRTLYENHEYQPLREADKVYLNDGDTEDRRNIYQYRNINVKIQKNLSLRRSRRRVHTRKSSPEMQISPTFVTTACNTAISFFLGEILGIAQPA